MSPQPSMRQRPARNLAIRLGLAGLVLIALSGYWLAPGLGSALIVPSGSEQTLAWPQIRIEPPQPVPGQRAKAFIADVAPSVHLELFVNGRRAEFERYQADEQAGIWIWSWSFVAPAQPGYEIAFYRNCDTGCLERARWSIGSTPPTVAPPAAPGIPTKLGVVFANPNRDWHNRNGWDVELTFAHQADAEYWGIDDLAGRVQAAVQQGLQVLVRVDYDQGQSLPPAEDYAALTEYLEYVARLARDQRLRDVYGYVIGSGPNAGSSNVQAPQNPVTPEWYARLFNGYGVDPARSDNVVQTIRNENRTVRILVGPVRPWVTDQTGKRRFRIDAPWLNYLNTLTAAIDASASAKAALGISNVAPDGFALQAPGRPDAPELAGQAGAREPLMNLRRPEWAGAQMGFRVFEDWLEIINAYEHTSGLPVFITSTNTSPPDTEVTPAENYPRGWLTNALRVVNHKPQIKALCWFIDFFPHDERWELFSLTDPGGLTIDAAQEFDELLQAPDLSAAP